MALIVVLFGFTLLSAAGLAGCAGDDVAAHNELSLVGDNIPSRPISEKGLPDVVPTGPEIAAVVVGYALSKANCAQCHAVNEQMVGPVLAGLTKRRPIS